MHDHSSRAPSVLQSCRTWLPTTQKWLHTQIRSLPETLETAICCRETANLDSFPIDHLHAFDDRRCDSTIASWAFRELRRPDVLGEPFRRLQRRRWADFRVECARQLGADVIHSHFGHTGWADRKVASRADLAHVVTFYGFDISYLPREEPHWYDRYDDLFESVDRVLCEGPHFAEHVADVGCPEAKIEVHHLGVDLEAHPYRPRQLESSTESPRVLIAGSFKEKKGIPDAVAALGQIKDAIDFELTIVGDATGEARSREEKRRIETKVRHYGLESRTRWLGFLSYEQLLEEIYDHHVLLSPSLTSSRGDTEGGAPVTIIAAQATGMPFVGTTHADLPHVIDHGRSGLLAEEGDVSGLARHLERLLDHPDRWREMGEAARDRIEREFHAERQGRRLADIYRQLAEST